MMKMFYAFTALSIVLMSSTSLQGQIFTRIADQETPVPGATNPEETFSDFVDQGSPWVSERCILLRGTGSAGSVGLYLVRNGTIEVVADLNTEVPGEASAIFSEFEEAFALDNCDVVFDGTGLTNDGDSETLGIYLKREGMPLEAVVNSQTPAPDGGTFSDFEDPWQEDDRIVFVANVEGGGCEPRSIYETQENGFSIVVDTCGGTPVPGGQPGEAFDELLETLPILEDGVMTFTAKGNQGTRGIYTEVEGTLQVVVDTNTPIPDGNGAVFDQFLGFTPTSGGDIVFGAEGPGGTHAGLYRPTPGGGIELMLDLLDPPLPDWEPGEPATEFGFWFCGGDLTSLGAVGMTSPEAIFLLREAGASRLIAAGETLDGMKIDHLSRFAFCTGDRIAFVAIFPDQQAIYLVTLPMFKDGFESGDTSAWSNTVP